VSEDSLHSALADWPLPLLAVQTTYSLNRGTGSPQAWAKALADLHGEGDGPWAALADRDDLCGLPACLRAWGKERVAIGASLDLAAEHDPRELICVLLAPDHEGYARLCQLLSWRHEQPDALKRWQQGLDAPPPCTGLIALVDDVDWLRRLREAGAETYWRWDLRPGDTPPGVPVVAAPIMHHLSPRERATGPLLHAIRNLQRSISATPAGSTLHDLRAMRDAYAGHEHAIERGRELLARCRYAPGDTLHFPPSLCSDPMRDLRVLAEEGLRRRYPPMQRTEATQRLEHELAVIAQKNFAGYIMTVYELAKGRRTCGRGSAASSMVCYCLGLTNVCPLAYRLVFERFLSPERVDPPDIDIDFPWDERDEVLHAAFERYGRAHVAMVATHLHYRRDSALRAAAKAHGIADDDVSIVQQRLREQRHYGRPYTPAPPWPEVLAEAARLDSAPRHFGLHPGGVVITTAPIRDLVPVHPAAKHINGEPIAAIAWEKDGAEELGLIKIDLLGNRSLAVVRDCLADLAEDGVSYDQAKWRPEDDPATRRLISIGRSIGCFYIESPAMRLLNAKAGRIDFDRLVVHSSVIRPAANKWIDTYLERLYEFRATGRHRPEWYPHPVMQALLSETYGILAYQEDVMLVCQHLAGFDSGGANAVRKALGRTDTGQRLSVLSDRFFSGCAARKVELAVAEYVWSQIVSFAGYSFCKAHSASYAMVSFECAYLKAHHPAYFLARVIANEGGFYSASAYIEEARRHGVVIRGACVMNSIERTRRESPGALRVGLHLVPHLSAAARAAIVRERPFRGVRDCIVRCALAERDVEALLHAGAFDQLMPSLHAAQRHWLVREILRDHTPTKKSRQLDLFDETLNDPTPPDLPAADQCAIERERYAYLGFCAPHHPLLLWGLPRRRWRTTDVCPANKQRWVEIIGMIITYKEVAAVTKNDAHESMSFVTIEDEYGIAETVWFPRTHRTCGLALEQSGPVIVQGQVDVSFGVATLNVTQARALEDGSLSPEGATQSKSPGHRPG
jgi:DNA polymerase-3 subunit alpha/error-prone DNA polymerase